MRPRIARIRGSAIGGLLMESQFLSVAMFDPAVAHVRIPIVVAVAAQSLTVFTQR
jgi:hypothetical protein